jgi:hypothetical protein
MSFDWAAESADDGESFVLLRLENARFKSHKPAMTAREIMTTRSSISAIQYDF